MGPDIQESIRLSVARYNEDLPQLIGKYKGKWVAYQEGRQIGIADTEVQVRELCRRDNRPEELLFIVKIQPAMTEAYVDWEM